MVSTELRPLAILQRKDAASIYDLDTIVCTLITKLGVNTMVLNINCYSMPGIVNYYNAVSYYEAKYAM
jgi:hypothetical protein